MAAARVLLQSTRLSSGFYGLCGFMMGPGEAQELLRFRESEHMSQLRGRNGVYGGWVHCLRI